MSYIKCVLCNGNISERDLLYNILVKCNCCGLITAKDFPSFDEINNIYSNRYFLEGEYCDYLTDKDIVTLNFRRYIKVIKNLKNSGTLLEIGCAYGLFLEEAKKFWHVEGIDISKDACEYAINSSHLDVKCGDFLSIDYPEDYFDIICMWDTVEHLREPHLYIQKCYRILKHGGILCLTTGDIGSLNARIAGRRWRLIHLPTHLFYFNKATISQLLRKYGFDIVHMSPVAVSRRISSMFYGIFLQDKSKSQDKLIRSICRLPLMNSAIAINLYDIMMVIGKKK